MQRSTAELAALEMHNALELWRAGVGLYAEGLFEREGGVAWFSSRLPAAFLNEVVPFGDTVSLAALELGVETMRRRGDPFIARIRDGVDDPLVPVLERLGMREDASAVLPGMAMHPIDSRRLAAAGAVDGLEVRRVVDAAGLAHHHEVMAAGFEMDLDLARALIPIGALAVPMEDILVGYVDGTPVVTSFGYTAQGTVGVYNVATVATHRRRGLGAALTARAVAAGADRGATVAILQSSAMGRSVYAALGFREVVTYRVFVDPSG